MRIPCLGPTGSHRTAGCPSPCSAPRARPPPLSCLSLQGMEDDPSWRDSSRPRGQWRLVWACRASEEGLARRWVTLSCADVPQAWQGSTSHPAPRPQEAAGVACGWEHFPELPFWATLTREAPGGCGCRGRSRPARLRHPVRGTRSTPPRWLRNCPGTQPAVPSGVGHRRRSGQGQ